jgi:hypothetical protein
MCCWTLQERGWRVVVLVGKQGQGPAGASSRRGEQKIQGDLRFEDAVNKTFKGKLQYVRFCRASGLTTDSIGASAPYHTKFATDT